MPKTSEIGTIENILSRFALKHQAVDVMVDNGLDRFELNDEWRYRYSDVEKWIADNGPIAKTMGEAASLLEVHRRTVDEWRHYQGFPFVTSTQGVSNGFFPIGLIKTFMANRTETRTSRSGMDSGYRKEPSELEKVKTEKEKLLLGILRKKYVESDKVARLWARNNHAAASLFSEVPARVFAVLPIEMDDEERATIRKDVAKVCREVCQILGELLDGHEHLDR